MGQQAPVLWGMAPATLRQRLSGSCKCDSPLSWTHFHGGRGRFIVRTARTPSQAPVSQLASEGSFRNFNSLTYLGC
jgi:hypothetical protein